MLELRRIIEDSEVMKEDDSNWPEPDRVGRQELEVVLGDEHISFTVLSAPLLATATASDACCSVYRQQKLAVCSTYRRAKIQRGCVYFTI